MVTTRSTLPSALSSNISADCRIGLAPSVGVVVANDARFPAASRMPAGSAARATVNEPTEVSSGPAPSVIAIVTVGVTTVTDADAPPLGTLARVQIVVGAV